MKYVLSWLLGFAVASSWFIFAKDPSIIFLTVFLSAMSFLLFVKYLIDNWDNLV